GVALTGGGTKDERVTTSGVGEVVRSCAQHWSPQKASPTIAIDPAIRDESCRPELAIGLLPFKAHRVSETDPQRAQIQGPRLSSADYPDWDPRNTLPLLLRQS